MLFKELICISIVSMSKELLCKSTWFQCSKNYYVEATCQTELGLGICWSRYFGDINLGDFVTRWYWSWWYCILVVLQGPIPQESYIAANILMLVSQNNQKGAVDSSCIFQIDFVDSNCIFQINIDNSNCIF